MKNRLSTVHRSPMGMTLSSGARGIFRVMLLVLVLFSLSAQPAAGEQMQAPPPESSGPPVVNGLFYGDGDFEKYTLFNTSIGGSGLYYYLDGATLYVALVVSRTVNDNVFGNRPYTTNAGWTPAHEANKLIDSEFTAFTLTCSAQTWNWQQGYAEYDGLEATWYSDHTAGAGSGAPPDKIVSSSSFVWNLNNYARNPTPNWDMNVIGPSIGDWKSPFDASAPDVVIGLEGYPETGPITYSPFYQWEWPMVYEWSAVLDPICLGSSLYIISGASHHSPAKSGPENDTFPPPSEAILTDFGDLPDIYKTLRASNGARHKIVIGGLILGELIYPEPDGQPTADASGDGWEEDGVWLDLAAQTVEVFVSNLPQPDTALLGGWFDWNNDGDFNDPGEFFAWTVTGGTNTLSFTMGPGFELQSAHGLYARFRLFANAAHAPGGSLDQGDYFGDAASGEVEDYYFTRSTAIGNLIWLDENSDGYQDAGEPGIPNVGVNLYDAVGGLVATTLTDSAGGYLFKNLWPGAYYVDVLDGTGGQVYSLPFAGMEQTPPSTMLHGDFGNQDHAAVPIPGTGLAGYLVRSSSTPAGHEILSADFGYNHRPADEVNKGTGTGAIGDRIWSDANGDGRQDPGEPGLAGVTVTLYHDPDGDGIYDTPYTVGGYDPVRITDAGGGYLFNDLPAGAYQIEVTPPPGYTQKGDPDQFGAACTICDDRTTTPIILAPGDVYVNADFGYQPPLSQNNRLGDRVWFDANADGIQDEGEPGIAGVTVALIRDTNGNGTWDGGQTVGEPIIATTVTDVNGEYLFTGVQDGRYLVWVNDTDNVLAGWKPVYDRDGGTPGGAPLGGAAGGLLGLSAVALDLAGESPDPVIVLDHDFGYTALHQVSAKGLVGDRVWLDINGDGVQDEGEPGLEGVRVELRSASKLPLAVTFTDENGRYAFGGLAAGTYTVIVMPPAGMVATYDADGLAAGSANRSTVTIGTGGVNLLQDFGYRGTGTIGNLVWEDVNADGFRQEIEPGVPGVTLALYRDLNGNGLVDPGEPLVGGAITGADGSYLFSGLPEDDGGGDAAYVVVVTDERRVLHGYWHSLGAAGEDDHSQTDPYAVTLTPGAPASYAADFGYYVKPAAVSNYVWLDLNNDGIQDDIEPGIGLLKVTLQVAYPDGTVVDVHTKTDLEGLYAFGSLLLDEDHNLADKSSDTPTYTILFTTPPSASSSPDCKLAEPVSLQCTIATDSNGASPVVAPLLQGGVDDTYDSGFFTDRLDLGDLPQGIPDRPNYPTLLDNGPANIVFPYGPTGQPACAGDWIAVWLGHAVEVEPNGQPCPSCMGDGDEEDGLRLAQTGWLAGNTALMTITLNSSAPTTVYYGLWIDWDFDGHFDEYYSGYGQTQSPKDVTLWVDVPEDFVANTLVYMRLRVHDQPVIESEAEGTLVNGEVEDYMFSFGPTAVRVVSLTASSSSPPAGIILSWVLLLVGAGVLLIRYGRRGNFNTKDTENR